jgi:phage terminase large subunit
VLCTGRRFGKTTLAIRELCYHARIPNRLVLVYAPSYRQAKQIAWVKLKQILKDLRWVARINEAELTIHLKNGSRICLRGADNPDSLRGVGIDFLVLDECADIQETAWTEVLTSYSVRHQRQCTVLWHTQRYELVLRSLSTGSR